jgi:hypothetical protein
MNQEEFLKKIIIKQSHALFSEEIENIMLKKFLASNILPNYDPLIYQEMTHLLSLINLKNLASFFHEFNSSFPGSASWTIEQMTEDIQEPSSQILNNRIHLFIHYQMQELLCPMRKFKLLMANLPETFDLNHINHSSYCLAQIKSLFNPHLPIGNFVLPFVEKQELEEKINLNHKDVKTIIKI